MLTDILVILDRSGSMQEARTDHEGGLRSFVADQRDEAGDARFTLVQFDSHDSCELVYDRVPINDVGAITLVPRGGTPLLDAVGLAVSHLQEQQAKEPADHTIAMIITDGQENASKEWTRERVKERLAELEKAGWTFLYLGANVDAFAEADSIGIGTMCSADYAAVPDSVKAAYASVTSNVTRSRNVMRGGGTRAAAGAAMNFTTGQRAAMAPSKTRRD